MDDEASRRDVVRTLHEQRSAVDERIAALGRERSGIVDSSDGGTDDEHDPEGATLAFEREQLSALLRSARARRAALDAALARVDAGTYRTCAVCGGTIPDGRAVGPSGHRGLRRLRRPLSSVATAPSPRRRGRCG